MTTATDRGHASDDGGARPGGDPPDPDGSTPGLEPRLREILAPFVAWLATQGLDEPGRRRHREAAERFLRWSHADRGPLDDRRLRYERHVLEVDPDHLAEARAGLSWWVDHRRILACTLPMH